MPPSCTLFIAVLVVALASAKVYERCELAKELLEKHKAPRDQVATWVCIAYHESRFNTSAKGPTGDHGLFQISQLYWCSPEGWACGVQCSELRDDDISDDFKCAKRVYRAHKNLAGQGFSAWAVYRPHCSSPQQVEEYTKGCFEKAAVTTTATVATTTVETSRPSTEAKTTTKPSTTVSPPTTTEKTEA